MPKYVFDTDTCIYWLKGNKNIEKRILKAGMRNIFISVITQCELSYGAFKSDKNPLKASPKCNEFFFKKPW